MKKIILLILVVLILLFSFSNSAFASSADISQEMKDKLFSSLDSETFDAFEYFEIDSFDPQSIYNFSFSSLIEYFSDDLSVKLNDVLKNFLLLCAVLIIVSIISNISNDKNDMFELIGVCAIVIVSITSLSNVINSIISVLNLCIKFMLSFIPIYASIIAFAASPSGALTYNTVTLAAAEGISIVSENYASNIIGAFYCLSISFSLGDTVNCNRFILAFNKATTIIFSFVSSLFASLLSIKGVLSVSVDTVASKGVKFLLGTLIPVVGSSISEAYSSLLGSINIIKSSAAAIGIIAVIVITFPALCEGFFCYISFSVLSLFCEMSSNLKASAIFKAFSAGIKFLILLLIFEVFVIIISSAIMLGLKNT